MIPLIVVWMVWVVLTGLVFILLLLVFLPEPGAAEDSLANVTHCCGQPLAEGKTGRPGMQCGLCHRFSRWRSHAEYLEERHQAIQVASWGHAYPGWRIVRDEEGRMLCRHEDELRPVPEDVLAQLAAAPFAWERASAT